jgi:hypothetical protein
MIATRLFAYEEEKRLKDMALFGPDGHPLRRVLERWVLLSVVSVLAWQRVNAASEIQQGSADLLSYDEIGRIHIKPPAAAPDAFTADAARIASLPALPDSKSVYAALEAVHALGMNPLTAFAAAPAAVAANAALKANQAEISAFTQQYLNAGIMTHISVHRDWTRIEVPVIGSASITRPDLGVTYFLDLAKHTYRETHTAAPTSQSEDNYTVSASDDVIVTFEKAPVQSPLSAMTLGGFVARGYKTEATFTLSGLIGWCSAGRHALTEVEYVADLADSQTPAGPPLEGSKWARDACLPASAGSHHEPGRLVIFRSTAFTGGGAIENFVNVLERGNIRTAERNDLSLFSVPTGFTKGASK